MWHVFCSFLNSYFDSPELSPIWRLVAYVPSSHWRIGYITPIYISFTNHPNGDVGVGWFLSAQYMAEF